MTHYPKDIMAAAMRALMVPEYDYVESVSAEILAERQRCANVARRLVLRSDYPHDTLTIEETVAGILSGEPTP